MGRYGRDGSRSAKYDRNPEFVSDTLEDLGGGLGVTDAVSGPALDEVQLEFGAGRRNSAPASATATGS